METKYGILQSGYLAKDTTNLVMPDPIKPDNINLALKLGKAIKDNVSPHHFHQELDKLFKEHNSNSRVLSNFDFREKLLLAIMDAINSKNFFDWCSIQKQSEYYSNLHYRFLKDTLDFIFTGSRKVAIETWLYLIKADKSNVNNYNLPDLTEDYSKNSGLLEDIITSWTSKRYGFKDLLYFGKIVFGKTFERKVG